MNNSSNKVRRRDFLTGAATAIGAGVLGVVPALGSAQLSTIGAPIGPSLFFWNGTQFIPATRMLPTVMTSESVGVRIEGFGTSPNIASIDVQMPGGLFHAFTSQPSGLKATQFTAPISTPLGLTLIVSSATSQSTLALHPGGTPGLKLAIGTYLMTDSGVAATTFQLTDSSDAPVVYADGQPLSIPYALIVVNY